MLKKRGKGCWGVKIGFFFFLDRGFTRSEATTDAKDARDARRTAKRDVREARRCSPDRAPMRGDSLVFKKSPKMSDSAEKMLGMLEHRQ